MPERIVVGVDFGTTFTGVAAVHTGAPQDLATIKTWPGGFGLTSEKVPSIFTYGDATAVASPTSATAKRLIEKEQSTSELSIHFPKFFTPSDQRYDSRPVRWGYQIGAHEDCLRYMKLFLDNRQKFPAFMTPDRMIGQLQSTDRGIVDAVADYLTAVHDHTKKQLAARWGQTLVDTTQIQYVLTVPAVWSDAAKDATRHAATRAGMGAGLSLISEPEAAAVHTMAAMRPNARRPGQNILVGDCGGGTVDLITYRITQIEPTLQVEESIAGTGGLCGSAFLDVRFETLVERKLGKLRFAHIRSTRRKAWPAALQDFETLHKRQFSLETGQTEWFIKFPGVADDPEIGVDEGFLVLSLQEMTSIFDPVIEDVIKLFDSQMTKVKAQGESISAIILVGGFGQSPYLHERLTKHFAIPESLDHIAADDFIDILPSTECSVEIMRPSHGWSAVVMGAAQRGLEQSFIASRRYRQHRGICVTEIFDPAKHKSWQKYWDTVEERWRATNVMSWIIPKNEKISNERTFSLTLGYSRRDQDFGKHTEQLWACQDDLAPQIFRDRHNRVASLRPHCTIVSDLSKVPKSLWVQKMNDSGRFYFRLDFEVEIKIDSAEMLCELKVGGVSYGSVLKSFDD